MSARATRWRRAVQAASSLFFAALPFASVRGHRSVIGTLVALRAGPVDLLEPASAISAALAARRLGLALALGALPLVALALALGPVLCSWMCPWGLASEGLDRLRTRSWAPRSWERVRAARAAALAAWLALSLLLAAPVAALVAAPRLATALPLELVAVGVLSPVTGGLLALLLVLELAGPRRAWCRALCPAGAAANYLRCRATLRIVVEVDRCRCAPEAPACHRACPWGIDPRLAGRFDGCTSCLACVDACPDGALGVRWRAAPAPGRRAAREGPTPRPGTPRRSPA